MTSRNPARSGGVSSLNRMELQRFYLEGTSFARIPAFRVSPLRSLMSNGPVLELSTLPSNHTRSGAALLVQCATSTIVRLSLDPTRLSPGTMSREVSVSWLARPGTGEPIRTQRMVGWNGLANYSGDIALQWCIAIPPQDTTEQAAIAIMALLGLMPADDTIKQPVVNALIKDGWTITHDPYRIEIGTDNLYVDLGAERALLGAERGLSGSLSR